MQAAAVDDRVTLAGLGVLAFALANVSHEAVGHGLATLAVGDKAVLLTTCYFNSSGYYSKWIPASGGLANVAVGLMSLLALRLLQRPGAVLRYFLVLVAAFNLFFAFGYPAYSGIARFGDWAAVIAGLKPEWCWRVLLVVISVAGYYGSMLLIGRAIAPFARSVTSGLPDLHRLRRITLIPYIVAIVVACLAGALNPKGLLTMLTSGLPAAAAAFGLTQMDHFLGRGAEGSQPVIGPMRRSPIWIVAAVLVLIFFVGVLGPGIRFSDS